MALSTAPVAGQDTKENADFKLAVSLFNDKLFDLALEQFRQFVATYPNTQQGIEARFYLGLAQSKLGKHEDARLTFQNFALAFPDHPKAPEAWWSVAEAYVAMKNAREAALAYERVKTFHPKSKLAPAALAKSAEYFLAAEDRESAKKVLRTLLQDYSSSEVVLPARLMLAEMYLAENQFELARSEAKRVAEGAKEPALRAQGFLTMAKGLSHLGRYEEARGALSSVIRDLRATPGYHEALLLLGFLQRDLGDLAEAQAAWGTVITDSARAPEELRQQAYLESGDAYVLGGEYGRALNQYERGAALRGPRRAEAFLKAGIAAEQSDAPLRASSFYRQVLEDTTGQTYHRAALLGAVRSSAARRNFNEAVSTALLFRDRYPSDPETPRVLFEAARIYQDELKDYRHAISLFEQVVNEFPSSDVADDALVGLAVSLRLLGSYDLAMQTFEMLERRYPASDYVERARQHAQMIRLFELKDRDSGMEKLALLVGDVIAGRSKEELAFRLAEIYFHELKEYDHAARQYAAALRGVLPLEKRAAAWYRRAKAYEYLAVRQTLGGGTEEPGAALHAIAAYDSLLRLFPAGEQADDAAVSRLKLRLSLATSVPDVRGLAAEFEQAYPTAKRRDRILYAVGEAYQNLKAHPEACAAYRSILQQHPSSDLRGEALFRLGEALLGMGALDTAAVVLEEYLDKYPKHRWSARAAWTLGQEHARKGNVPRAVSLFRMIEEEFPYTSYAARAAVATGDAHVDAGEYAAAVRSYLRHLGSYSSGLVARANASPDLLMNLATCYERLGNRAEAKRYFALVVARDPASPRAGQAYYALAGIAREENNVTLAARYFQEASRYAGGASGDLNRAALEAAELLFRNEEYAEAIVRFSDAAQRAKGDTLPQYLQSRIIVSYFRLNNLREADERAAVFLKTNPHLQHYAAEFEYERGMFYLRRDDLNSARRLFEGVVQRYPTAPVVPQALYGAARVAEQAGRTQDALRLYESILQRYPASAVAPRAQLALGNLLYAQEQWEPAARHYKAVLENEERAPELVRYAMNNLILAYKELSLFDLALELNRQYIDRFPDDPELINKRIDIGILYQRLGYYDLAIVHLQTLLDYADADLEAEVRYYIGEAFFYKGDYQQAILEFLKVPYLVTRRTKNDWVATSFYMAGQSYEKMSRFEQAVTMYQQIIDRPGIDATFKTAAQREIERVNALVRVGR